MGFNPNIDAEGLSSIRKNWGWFLLLGIFLILLGSAAVALAYATTLITIIFIGCLMIVGGVAKLLYSFYSKEWNAFFVSLLIGLFYLIAGLLFLFKPVQAAAGLTLIIGALFLVSGIFKIIATLTVKFPQWGWVLFSGIVSTLLGFLVLADWPEASLWVIGMFLGIDLIVYGWSLAIIAMTARSIK